MQNAERRLKVNVTLQGHGISLHFRVHSISPEHFERFSLNFTELFLSVHQCANKYADSMSRTYFKVMGFSFHIRVYSISPEPFESFSLNHSNVPLSKKVCRTHDSVRQTQGQGHTSR